MFVVSTPRLPLDLTSPCMYKVNNRYTGTLPAEFGNGSLKKIHTVGNDFVGDYDPIVCNATTDYTTYAFPYEDVNADCLDDQVTCSCCTTCCDSEVCCEKVEANDGTIDWVCDDVSPKPDGLPEIQLAVQQAMQTRVPP